tara:strand:- start:140 stop:382 length:243 start_codon:yes stop_codon:yes gene_type:complete
MNKKLLLLTAIASLSLGCVGMGVTVSPADGLVSLEFRARDCITDNVAGKTVAMLPLVGDWAMLNYGCAATEAPLVDRPIQ